ncbi:hypothetical protein COOONC_24799 [Cooperia oncophora]
MFIESMIGSFYLQTQVVSNNCSKGRCPECNAGPMALKNLYALMFVSVQTAHEDSRSKSNKENELPCGKMRTRYSLRKRDWPSVSSKDFAIHSLQFRRKIHNTTLDQTVSHVICPSCGDSFTSHSKLAGHCLEKHGGENPDQDYAIIHGHLENWRTFEDWKHAKELSTQTHFVVRTSRESSKGRSIAYVCQHSRGAGEVVDSLAIRRRYRISKRIHSHCSAFLNVVLLADGQVDYSGSFGHIGHVITTATLPLSPEDENVIVEMLKSGLTPSIILTKIRSERWDPSLEYNMQPRLCYLSLKDIKNVVVLFRSIAQKKGLVAGRLHQNDLLSLEELLESSADVVDYSYKKSIDPTGDGFVLALMTKSGKKFLERYGYKGLVFDDTFDVSRYSFRLATLLVVTDSGRGFPCCFLISYRMTSEEVAELFLLVKKSIPEFDTRFIMTDDTNVFYNAFSNTFPQSRAQKILCSFHVSKCFQRKLNESLQSDDAKLGQRLFRELFHQALPSSFERKYAAFVTWISSKDPGGLVEVSRNLKTSASSLNLILSTWRDAIRVGEENGRRATEESPPSPLPITPNLGTTLSSMSFCVKSRTVAWIT